MDTLLSVMAPAKPVVGVFLSSKQVHSLARQEPLFKIVELVEANQEAQTLLYFFSIDDVDLKNDKISGICFNRESNIWERRDFPFPDVLYNRRAAGAKDKKLRKLMEAFQSHGVRLLNSVSDFNKWEVYCRLRTCVEIRDHLPLTVLYKSPSSLLKMLNRNTTLYLKACAGRRSLRVLRVCKLPFGYECRHVIDELKIFRFKDFNGLLAYVKSFFNGHKFLIQSSIDLLDVNGCISDMLAEMQRNGQGELEITGIVARVAQENSPVTSVRTTEKIYESENFFKNILDYSDDEFKELNCRIEKFLVTAYQAIENSYGPFGELGIDFALDSNGKLWFIECNSKSAKVALCKSHNQEVIRRVFLNPLEYARYLANN